MRKFLLLGLISLISFSFVGCNKREIDDNSLDSSTNLEENSIFSSNTASTIEKNNFSLVEKSSISSLFYFKDTTLFFPNWDDNNKISLVSTPDKNIKLNNSNIGDFFDYSTNSMSLFQNSIFFANGNDGHTLYKLNLTTKSAVKINNRKIRDITTDSIRLYYIDYATNELFLYDPIDNISTKLISNKVGKFIVNGNNVIYQNASDNYKLYRASIDGNINEKLTNYSVDSFTVLDNTLFFINSSDNNNLYTLSPTDLSARRIGQLNGTSIMNCNGNLLFIDQNDSNKLKSITLDLKENKFSLKTLINDPINDFYYSEKGIFYRKGIDVNSIYYFLPISKPNN